jgi:hypothetical protein
MEHLSGVLDLGTHEEDGPETWEAPDLPQKREEGRVRHGTAGAVGIPAAGGEASLWREAKGVLVCPERWAQPAQSRWLRKGLCCGETEQGRPQ